MLFGMSKATVEQGMDIRMFVATGLEAVPEILEPISNIRGGGTEGEDTVDCTEDEPCQHTRGVGGARGNVEVQVEGLGVKGGSDSLILNGESKIKEVHL